MPLSTIQSELLTELSGEEQQLLSGGKKFTLNGVLRSESGRRVPVKLIFGESGKSGDDDDDDYGKSKSY